MIDMCYRCGQPVHEASKIESPRGIRHPYVCSARVPAKVEAPVAAIPSIAEKEVPVVVQVVKSNPEVILALNKTKAAIVALAAAVLGSVATVVAKTYL